MLSMSPSTLPLTFVIGPVILQGLVWFFQYCSSDVIDMSAAPPTQGTRWVTYPPNPLIGPFPCGSPLGGVWSPGRNAR